jgi:L-cysteine desulfidase
MPKLDDGYKAILIALEGIQVTEKIVADDVDRSIANLGEVACQGMVQTDGQILQITLNNKLVVGHSTLD